MNNSKARPIYSISLGIFKRKWSVKTDYFKLFLVCSFPIHVWAYINLFNDMPAILLEMGIWRILGVSAYVLLFALLESLSVFGLIFIVAILLPERIFGLKILHLGSIFVIASAIPVLFVHLYDELDVNVISFANWTALWVLVALFIFGIVIYWLKMSETGQGIFQAAIDRLVVLSLVYISFDLLGLFVIIMRNIIGPL